MAREDEGTAATIVAFILGAITGASVALLFAPASGEELRRKVGEKARDGRERATDAARQGREFLNRQRENVTSAVERGREAYHQARGTTPAAPGGGEGGENL
jgi:gas vesicle protein